MSRRRFIQSSAALMATLPAWLAGAGRAATSTTAAAAASAMPLKRLGSPEPFDYARLKGLARSMAGSPYKAPTSELPSAIAKLSWDEWESIRFRDEHSLWAGDGLRFQARFLHLGFTIKKPVRMFSVENGMAQELAFDPALFDYSQSGVNARRLPPTLGFAGFKLLFQTDWQRDVAVW